VTARVLSDDIAMPGITTCTATGLTSRAEAARSFLVQAGEPGERVAILSRLHGDAAAAVLAIRHLGYCAVPIDCSLSLEELAFALNDSRARTVLTDAEHAPRAEQLRVLTPYVASWRTLSSPAEVAPSTAPAGSSAAGSLHYNAAATGRPAGYVVPDPLQSAGGRRDLQALLGAARLAPDRCVMLTTPLSDPAALQLAVAAHDVGATVAFADRADPEQILAGHGFEPPSIIHLSPALALSLAKWIERGADVRWSPQLALISAPGCPPAVARGLIEAWGPVVRQVYLGPGVGAIAAIDGVDVLLHPGTMGEPLTDAGAPRIRIRSGAGAASGLIEAEHPAGSGQWVGWGDRGLLARGRLVVLDGHQVGDGDDRPSAMPQAIESALVSHPWVADVAVVVKRVYGQPRVLAYVQKTSDAVSAQLESTLLEELAEQFPAGWVPDRIEVVPVLPRTASGKLDRRRLISFDPLDNVAPM
jgi:long-chain acyl-CoA synthetase